jgi:hypothetical protein
MAKSPICKNATSPMFGMVLVVRFILAGEMFEARKRRGAIDQPVILDRRNQPSL